MRDEAILCCPVAAEGSHAVGGIAVDYAGNTASLSLTVNVDLTPPSLVALSPPPGATIGGSPLTVTGSVFDSLSGLAAVTCNGTPASREGGTFTCAVPLTPGSNQLSLAATDVAGNTTLSSLAVVFEAHPVDAWLGSRPAVAQAMVFYESYATGWRGWTQWSDGLRQALRDAYDLIASGAEPPIPAPANQWVLTDAESFYLTALADASTGADSLSTIGSVLQWERDHLRHRGGSFGAAVAEYYWGRRSLPPVEAILLGRVPRGSHPEGYPPTTHAHFSNGCGSVGDLARAVLAPVNIPVGMPVTDEGHGGISLPSEGAWLSHGDSLYDARWQGDRFYHPLDLLLDGAEWQQWFPISSTQFTDTPVVYEGANLDVEVPLMILERLPAHVPGWLLADYCQDIQSGLPASEGLVYATFQPYFTVDQLNDLYGLWAWMAHWASVLGCQ